jgi:hypothetical protein
MAAQFHFNEIKLRVHVIRLDETSGLNIPLALEDGRNELLLRLKKLAYRSLDNPCPIPSERFGEFIHRFHAPSQRPNAGKSWMNTSRTHAVMPEEGRSYDGTESIPHKWQNGASGGIVVLPPLGHATLAHAPHQATHWPRRLPASP